VDYGETTPDSNTPPFCLHSAGKNASQHSIGIIYPFLRFCPTSFHEFAHFSTVRPLFSSPRKEMPTENNHLDANRRAARSRARDIAVHTAAAQTQRFHLRCIRDGPSHARKTAADAGEHLPSTAGAE
jgi:hypothetical protein